MSHPHRPLKSAGVLLYRLNRGRGIGNQTPVAERLEVYLVHPGGPYFKNKDVWGIAKGLVENGESLDAAARREFEEETGFQAPGGLMPLGSVTGYRGKIIHGFAGAWDSKGDPPAVQSNTCPVEWPPNSGSWIDIPEVDDGRFFGLAEARLKLHHGQEQFLDRLIEVLG